MVLHSSVGKISCLVLCRLDYFPIVIILFSLNVIASSPPSILNHIIRSTSLFIAMHETPFPTY